MVLAREAGGVSLKDGPRFTCDWPQCAVYAPALSRRIRKSGLPAGWDQVVVSRHPIRPIETVHLCPDHANLADALRAAVLALDLRERDVVKESDGDSDTPEPVWELTREEDLVKSVYDCLAKGEAGMWPIAPAVVEHLESAIEAYCDAPEASSHIYEDDTLSVGRDADRVLWARELPDGDWLRLKDLVRIQAMHAEVTRA